MDKYKINYTFEEKIDINTILIKVLVKELKKVNQTIYKNKDGKLLLSQPSGGVKE